MWKLSGCFRFSERRYYGFGIFFCSYRSIGCSYIYVHMNSAETSGLKFDTLGGSRDVFLKVGDIDVTQPTLKVGVELLSWFFGGFGIHVPQLKVEASCAFFSHRYPDAQCMVYLPTFTKNYQNIDKYAIPWASGVLISSPCHRVSELKSFFFEREFWCWVCKTCFWLH